MAIRIETIQHITDDIDGSGEASTVEFAFAGVSYEIDLNAENLAEFEEVISQYIAAGRRAVRRPGAPKQRTTRAGRDRSASGNAGLIRTWAKANGIEVAERGRIRPEVTEAYERANGSLSASSSTGNRVVTAPGQEKPGKKNKKRVYPQGLRPWARENGYKVGNSAIDPVIVAAFYAANPNA